ncbi:MAG: hypothetical protein AB9882_02630 [Ignavibacteriaceae bacterium]
MAVRILIADSDAGHAALCKAAIVSGYGLGGELISDLTNRDVSTGNDWTNSNLSMFGNDGVLSLGTTLAGEYCTLPVLSAPTEIGKSYKLIFDVLTVNTITSSFLIKSFDGVQSLGSITTFDVSTTKEITFVAATIGGLKIISTGEITVTLDNFSLKEIPDISAEIEVKASLALAIEEATTNPNIIAILRSYTGVASAVELLSPLYPRVLGFYPLGSNLNELLSVFTDEEPPIVVASGAGDTEERNNTGYGPGLEYWDNDLTDADPADLSSFSNGVVLGKLLKIKDTLMCPWWEARYRARRTASQIESNRLNLGWDIYNGYGKINESDAVAYKGVIPLDPYLFSAETFNELTDDVADLTAANGELTGQLAELEEFEFTKNVIGIAEEQDTYFGSSEAYKLRNIAVNPEGLVTLTKSLHRDRESFSKRAIKEIPETFVDRDIIDFVYHKYKQLHNIPEQDIIT